LDQLRAIANDAEGILEAHWDSQFKPDSGKITTLKLSLQGTHTTFTNGRVIAKSSDLAGIIPTAIAHRLSEKF
jgi:hypothetical protein